MKNYLLKSIFLFIQLYNFNATAQQVKIDKVTINNAIAKGSIFLLSIQQNDGAICDTTNRLFDIWETILASDALIETGTSLDNKNILKAYEFLKKNENSEGFICHNAKCKAAYCIETSALYFSLLKYRDSTILDKKIIKKIIEFQQEDGSWLVGNPDVFENTNFPSATAFILDMLTADTLWKAQSEKAQSWLKSKQKFNGTWGYSWEYYGCPSYPLWPILKVNTDRSSRKKALAYIYTAQLKNGSWFHKDTTYKKQTSASLQTALMLNALFNGKEKKNTAIKKAILFLLNMQNKNGSWDGGFFPIPSSRYIKKEYLIATALSIKCLKWYSKIVEHE